MLLTNHQQLKQLSQFPRSTLGRFHKIMQISLKERLYVSVWVLLLVSFHNKWLFLYEKECCWY